MKNLIDKINKMRSTEKGKTLFKFIIYMIFFITVLLTILITNFNNQVTLDDIDTQTPDKEVVENKPLTYLDKQNKLISGNYKYKYVITGPIEVVYTGEVNNNITKGIREDNEKTIKYKIENGKTYETKLKQDIEITDLYRSLDSTLFDFNLMFNTLNVKNTLIDRQENYKTYTYNDIDGYNYIVTLTDTEITKINITNGTLNYEYTFTY